MTGIITRRDSLVLGAAALGASAVPIIGARAQDAAPTDVPTADVKPPEFKIEKGAELHVLRPAKFIDPDQVYWDINTKKFTEKTGHQGHGQLFSWEDLRAADRGDRQYRRRRRTSSSASASTPFIYTDKLVGMNDLAEYLGAKYGGWYDLALLYGTQMEDATTGSRCRSAAAPDRRCIASPGSRRPATTRSRTTSTGS